MACGATATEVEVFAQAQRDQHTARVRRNLQPGSGLLEFFGLFEYRHAHACTRECQRSGQAANAGSGNNDMTRGRHGGRVPIGIRLLRNAAMRIAAVAPHAN